MVKYFHFHNTLTKKNFDAKLESDQCRLNKKNGTRCKKRCQIGMSICWIHLLSQCHLRIKKSGIRNAGMGVFALDNGPDNFSRRKTINKRNLRNVLFKKKDVICEYNGEFIDNDELKGRYDDKTAPYGVQLNNNETEYEDAAIYRGVGSMINHSNDKYKVNCQLDVFDDDNDIERTYIIATKNIYNNQELFIDYNPNENQSRAYIFNEHHIKTTTNYKRLSI